MTAAAQDKTKVTLGTATPGGGFPVYGQAVTETIHDVDPTLEIEPRNTKGSTENVPLLEKGEVDIALVQGEVAIESIGKLPIVTAMYATAGSNFDGSIPLTAANFGRPGIPAVTLVQVAPASRVR